ERHGLELVEVAVERRQRARAVGAAQADDETAGSHALELGVELGHVSGGEPVDRDDARRDPRRLGGLHHLGHLAEVRHLATRQPDRRETEPVELDGLIDEPFGRRTDDCTEPAEIDPWHATPPWVWSTGDNAGGARRLPR